jgi:hypothetical protein
MSESKSESKTEAKRFSISTVVIVSAIVGAAAFAAGRSMHDGGSSSAGAAMAIASEPPVATTTSTTLPPGHPPVESTTATTTLPSPAASAESSLSWKVPAKWQVVPNASSMRLATYRIGPDAEMAVSQAGGAIDANVDRWIGQFGPDAKKNAKVTTKKVSGLDVTIVEVEGTYGGGMAMGPNAGSGSKEGWALLGAIVATPGMPHFFKLTGPAKTVKDARQELDQLLASLTTK